MNYWLIADLHLGHNMLHTAEYGGRPVGFEQKILNNLMNICMPEDVLICLGDVAFYRDEFWHKALKAACPSKMWLILGNHDKKSKGWYLSHGWDFVADSIALEIYGKNILFTHKPCLEMIHHYDLNIHGHLHNSNRYPIMSAQLNAMFRLVSVEHDYLPISLRKLADGSTKS